MTFPLNEMYGYSRLCDRLRSSAIIWKQVSLRSSAIYGLRSAIVCDRLRSFAIIWKPAFTPRDNDIFLSYAQSYAQALAVFYPPKVNQLKSQGSVSEEDHLKFNAD